MYMPVRCLLPLRPRSDAGSLNTHLPGISSVWKLEIIVQLSLLLTTMERRCPSCCRVVILDTKN